MWVKFVFLANIRVSTQKLLSRFWENSKFRYQKAADSRLNHVWLIP